MPARLHPLRHNRIRAPAASAASASAIVDTFANQTTPRAFNRVTKPAGNNPITEDTIGAPASSNASHCASKSGGAASPASSGTAGPHCPRNARTSASCTGSRRGAGSGTHRFIWNAPLLPARTARTQSAICPGDSSSAPQLPSPPAFATATDNAGGQAPAVGASRIGTRSPKRPQNAAARPRGATIWLIVRRYPIRLSIR